MLQRFPVPRPVHLIAAAGLLAGAFADAPARAADGVLELSQVCAEQTGCVPGDAPGYPITLSAAGSHRLTSNLLVPDLDTTAIEVLADDVSIDLAGFVIRNRVDCRPDCGAPGNGDAVVASGRENLSLRNGSVVGMGRSAVRAGDLATIEGLRAIGQGGSAIVLGDRSAVRDTIVQGAGGVGIAVGHESAVEDSVVRSATGIGLRGESGVLVVNNRIVGNGDVGVRLRGRRGAVIENVIASNGGEGVWGEDALVVHNVVSANRSAAIFLLSGEGGVIRGNQVTENSSGVDVAGAPGTVVTGNSIVANAGSGIVATTPDGHDGNVLTANGGTISGGSELGGNACNGNTTCP